MIIFFLISFITNIIGPLIPDIIKSFNLSLTAAGILPFSFFIAYFNSGCDSISFPVLKAISFDNYINH